VRSNFVFLVIMVSFSLLVAEFILNDPGYVLLAYESYVLETSLFVAFLVTVLFAVVAALLVYLASRLLGVRSGLSQWITARGVKLARQKTTLGLIELAEGHWSKARKLLDEAADDNDHPLINYLNAARAADELGDVEGRDEYLKLAHETKTGKPSFAVGLTQAQLQFKRKDWEHCLATLQRLRENAPKHGYVMKMLVQVYQETEEWEKLCLLLPELRKSKENPFSEDDFVKCERHAYLNRLNAVAKRKSAEASQSQQLTQLWHDIPKSLSQDAELQLTYAQNLVSIGDVEKAARFIESSIDLVWSDEMIHLYGCIPFKYPEKASSVVLNWLRRRPKSASALLAVGRISLQCEQWQRAQTYFEHCLSEKQSAEVYGELARLLAGLGQHAKSNEYFQKGLAKLSEGLPELPLPIAQS